MFCVFHMPIGHICIPFGEMSVKVLCPFKKSGWLSFSYQDVWAPYLFGILTPIRYVRKCLLPIPGLPFHFADCSLCCVETFSWWSYVSAFVFVAIFKKLLPMPTSRSFPPIFSFQIYGFSSYIKVFTPFFTDFYARPNSPVSLLCVWISVLLVFFAERTVSTCVFLLSLLTRVYFLAILVYWSMCLFYTILIAVDYDIIEIRKCDTSYFFFLKISLAVQSCGII